MRLPWPALLLSPGFEQISGFRTGTIAAVVVIFDLAWYCYLFLIFRFRRYHATQFSRSDGVIRSPFSHSPLHSYAHLPTLTIGTLPARAYFTLPSDSARDRIFFHGAFYAQTPNNALFPPRQTGRSGIHSAVLYHHSFIRSCLFEAARAKMWPDYEQDPRLRIGEGGRSSPCPSGVAVNEADPEPVDSGVL